MNKVIVIDPDCTIAQSINQIRPEITVKHFMNAESFFLSSEVQEGAIFLIANNLPGIHCRDVVRIIRHHDKLSPIAILGASEENISCSLELGADSFVVLPIKEYMLGLLINNSIQKINLIRDSLMNNGTRLLPGANSLMKDGITVCLTGREFQIISHLWKTKDKICTRKELADSFGDGLITERTIDVHVSSLRKKIEKVDLSIETVRGKGYKIA